MPRKKSWGFHICRIPRAGSLVIFLIVCALILHDHCTAGIAMAQVPGPTDTSVPAVPAAGADHPIDLETALTLAGVENPTIALAMEAVRASLAEQMGARSLLLPTLDAGMNLNVHRGNLQSSQGIIENIDRQALYVGAGAAAIGAGTVSIPGVRITAHLADAVFAPRVARQQVVKSRLQSLATQYAVLLEVATLYFDLVGAEARLAATRQSEEDLAEVVRVTANFARTGLGRDGDAQRAKCEAHLLHIQEEGGEGDVAVASAELARLLNLDPAIRLRGPGEPIPLIQLIDPRANLDDLIQIAVANHPEIAARTADMAANEIRLRQEKVRPFVPFLSVGFSAGEFGGGSDRADLKFGHFSGRTDFDVLAVWSLHNLGVGNLAIARSMRAEVNQAAIERARAIDRIGREIASAYALSAARASQVEIARSRQQTAQRAYRLDLARAKNLQGLPIEVLNSLNLLNSARQDLIRALVEYNQAQFHLFVSLGQPPDAAIQQ
jgi:outer membrane protein TolC